MSKNRSFQFKLNGIHSPYSILNRLGRVFWSFIRTFLFLPSPRIFTGWRCFILRCFGAKIGKGVKVYSSVRIWAPWNLTIGDYSAIDDYVDCYNAAPIDIGKNTIISRDVFLCTASHDYSKEDFPVFRKRIIIKDSCWIAARSFIHPGVTINNGVVVGAQSVVTNDIEEGIIVAGNPAHFIKNRIF